MTQKKEIGGYIELEHSDGIELHSEAIALNSGRNCLEYLIKTRNIKKIYLPYFCCKSISQTCEKNHVEIIYYHIDESFHPILGKELGNSEWLYIINYYGQLTNNEICTYKEYYNRIIIDNAQAYYQMPIDGVDTLYTCRKFFGVADGAFLYTDTILDVELIRDESYGRIGFLMGRFERSASEFYSDYLANNEILSKEPLKKMSSLTENMLKVIDYEKGKEIRTRNFSYLSERFRESNRLSNLIVPEGAFMYPLYFDGVNSLRRILAIEKIYIPTLWPNVLEMPKDTLEYQYAQNILPLPCDQRYGTDDMEYIFQKVFNI